MNFDNKKMQKNKLSKSVNNINKWNKPRDSLKMDKESYNR